MSVLNWFLSKFNVFMTFSKSHIHPEVIAPHYTEELDVFHVWLLHVNQILGFLSLITPSSFSAFFLFLPRISSPTHLDGLLCPLCGLSSKLLLQLLVIKFGVPKVDGNTLRKNLRQGGSRCRCVGLHTNFRFTGNHKLNSNIR